MSEIILTPQANPKTLPALVAARRAAARLEFSGGGWLSYCQDQGIYQVISRELACGLRSTLRDLGADTILEVAAGDGSLARAVSEAGLRVLATDLALGCAAHKALIGHRPSVVLSCFAPYDSDIDARVMASPAVRYYLVINASCNGEVGSERLRSATGWQRHLLCELSRLLLTRFDTPLDRAGESWIPHGQAWLLTRKTDTI